MSSLSTTGAQRRPVTPALIAAIRQTAREWQVRYHARCQLAAMSDRELQDIGTSRAEVTYEVSKPFWQK